MHCRANSNLKSMSVEYEKEPSILFDVLRSRDIAEWDFHETLP